MILLLLLFDFHIFQRLASSIEANDSSTFNLLPFRVAENSDQRRLISKLVLYGVDGACIAKLALQRLSAEILIKPSASVASASFCLNFGPPNRVTIKEKLESFNRLVDGVE